MIIAPDSFLAPNSAVITASAAPKSSADFLSKYSVKVPTAIATLVALSTSDTTMSLDASFEPGCYDVVFGRGKGFYNRPGNKHFRALVASHIADYQQARTKVDKSAVLNGIVDQVRSYVDPQTGAPAQFVKYDKRSTAWVQIGDDHAREKVGHAIREAMQQGKDGMPSMKRDQSTSPVPIQKQTAIVSHDELETFTWPAELHDSIIGLEIDVHIV